MPENKLLYTDLSSGVAVYGLRLILYLGQIAVVTDTTSIKLTQPALLSDYLSSRITDTIISRGE